MDEAMRFNPCAFCLRCCKTVIGILLIVLGVNLLKSKILSKNDQK